MVSLSLLSALKKGDTFKLFTFKFLFDNKHETLSEIFGELDIDNGYSQLLGYAL